MSSSVKGSSRLREARKADTEQRIIEAATRRFLVDGYIRTTLTAVAAEAGVGDRTVYARFGNKAELLKRVIDVAIVGDTANIPLVERDWPQRVLTEPTLHGRIQCYADGCATMMQRLGPLLAVAAEAEPIEPLIAAAAQAGRTATHEHIAAMWTKMHADGLLHPDADLDWIIATASLLGAAETYVLMRKTLAWTPTQYRDWLRHSWIQFATGPRPESA